MHGANRLASNSLLEGMVFGARLAEAIAAGRDGPAATGVMRRACRAGPAGRRARSPASTSTPASTTDADIDADTDVDRTRRDARTPDGGADGADVAKLRDRLQRAMTDGAGVLRSPAVAGGGGRRGRAEVGRRTAASPWPAATGAPPASSPTW